MCDEVLSAPTEVEIKQHRVRPGCCKNKDDLPYAFGDDQITGWYLSDMGEITTVTNGHENVKYNDDYTLFLKPIIFTPICNSNMDFINTIDISNKKGMLYLKSGTTSLYWKTEEDDINITNGGLPDQLRIPNGSSKLPSYSFTNANKTGMFLTHTSDLSFSVNGVEKLRLTPHGLRNTGAIELINTIVTPPVTATIGKLYKKAGSNGLWWNTSEGGEINLVTEIPDKINQEKGTASAPSYSFDADKDSGIFLNGTGNVSTAIGGVARLEVKHAEISTNLPVRSNISGSASLPAYSFMKSKTTGMYSSSTGHVSFASNGAQVLDVSNNSVDIMANIPFKIRPGLSTAPSLTFTNESNTGLYHTQNAEIGIAIKGTEKIKIGSAITTFKVPINTTSIKTTTGNEKVPSYGFANYNSYGMYYNPNNFIGISYNCTTILKIHDNGADVTGVIKSTYTGSTPAYTFNNSLTSGLYKNALGIGVKYTDSGADIHLSNNKISFNKPLEIMECGLNEVPTSQVGVLYKKVNDAGLWWNVNGIDINLLALATDTPAADDGSAGLPSYSFNSDLKTGMYLAGTNTIGVSSNGQLVLSSNSQDTTIYNTLVIKDTGLSSPALSTEGRIYKKPDNKGLWWNTLESGEVNLLQTYYPLKADRGSAALPSYSFASDPSTGLYNIGSGGIGVSVGGEQIFNINNDKIQFNKILEIKDLDNDDQPLNGSTIGQLYKKTDNENLYWRTQHGGEKCLSSNSKPFIVGGSVINNGDIVGVINDGSGKIDKISGGKWHDEHNFTDGKTSIMHMWDGVNDNLDLHIHTYENVSEVKNNNNDEPTYISTFTLKVETVESNIINPVLNVLSQNTLELEMDSVSSLYPKSRSVACVKVEDEPKKYILAYGDYENLTSIILKKIRVDIISGTPSITTESTITYTPSATCETFDMVYENSGSLDILTIVMYSVELNNFEAALFAVNPGTSNPIQKGYSQSSFATNPITGDNKTCKTLLLPGQVVVCSYSNYKTFLLLPSSYMSAFDTGGDVVDNDSSDCVDMIYDAQNAVIISVEKTISNTSFLQIYDIFGLDITQMRSKKIGNSTVIPLGLGLNPLTDNFTLFYSNAEADGQIFAQLFNHDGELINLGLIYIQPSGALYNSILTQDNIPVPNNGKLVWYKAGNHNYVCWPNGTTGTTSAIFNDNYGIQPAAFIGFADVFNGDVKTNNICSVVLKGQIYNNVINLPINYVGKKIYLDNKNINLSYPNNITTNKIGNNFIGTCITQNDILVGL